MRSCLTALFFLSFLPVKAQLYYPPATGTWDTLPAASLGWCEDSVNKLYDYLEQTNTDAFIVLKDGKIVLEKYFGSFTQNSVHVWNSAGKTLTAFAVGIAQSEGYLDISDTTSHILGYGWTSLSTAQEEKITVRHQLTMTTGLNDSGNNNCTDPSCLTYLADPGTRWAYHTGAYTLLDSVIQVSTGQTPNAWVDQKIEAFTGMTGNFYTSGYNHIYVSNARSMARFGLLLLSGGTWNGNDLLNDPVYFQQMTNSSQSLNESYGYLTWLNGQSSFMIPQSQFVFSGPAMPSGPADTYAALGKNAQFINVVPSQNLVLVRMGASSGSSLVEITYNDTVWQYMNRLGCTLGTTDIVSEEFVLCPNPSTGQFWLQGLEADAEISVTDQTGRSFGYRRTGNELQLESASPGIYFITVLGKNNRKTCKVRIE